MPRHYRLIVAGLYGDASDYDQLKIDANKPGASAELQQQLAVVTNTMTELAKLTGAGGALLIGGDAETMQIAMGTAANVAVNNRQLHTNERALAQRLAAQSGGRFTVEQIEDALRNSGNSKRNETVVTGLVVNKNDPNGVYDSDAVFKDGSPGTNTSVQQLPNEGQVDAGLASFIQSNTGGESSPYAWSPGQLGQPPAPAAGQQPNGSSEVRYETRIVDGQAYTVPVVNCPAAGCASTDNVARFGLNAQDQATVAVYDNALDRQTAKGVGTILIGGIAVAATPVTLAGAVIGGASVGGAESVKDQVIDTGSVNAGQTITDTAVGAMVGVAAVGGVYVLGKFVGWVNGKPLVEFAGGRTALVNDAASVKPLSSQGVANSGVNGGVTAVTKTDLAPPPNTYPVDTRGAGAAEGPLPSGYTTVSRWVSPEKASLWVQNQGTAIPTAIPRNGTPQLYVTEAGAPYPPGANGTVRIDFAVPNTMLKPGNASNNFMILQPSSSTPIYNVKIHVPNGVKLPAQR